MSDITNLYFETARSFQEQSTKKDTQLYVPHQSDVFTRECLKVVSQSDQEETHQANF